MKSKARIIKELQSEISQNNDRYFEAIFRHMKAADENDTKEMESITRELEAMEHEWALYTSLIHVAETL